MFAIYGSRVLFTQHKHSTAYKEHPPTLSVRLKLIVVVNPIIASGSQACNLIPLTFCFLPLALFFDVLYTC